MVGVERPARKLFDGCSRQRLEKEMATTPVFLPGESQERGSLVGCPLRGRTESGTTEVT